MCTLHVSTYLGLERMTFIRRVCACAVLCVVFQRLMSSAAAAAGGEGPTIEEDDLE
jgi:hypothetical protein